MKDINISSLMYFREKIGESLGQILIHKGAAKQRLIDQQSNIIFESKTLMPTLHSRTMWTFVIENMNIIDSIDNETASDIIDKINKTHFEVKEYLMSIQSIH